MKRPPLGAPAHEPGSAGPNKFGPSGPLGGTTQRCVLHCRDCARCETLKLTNFTSWHSHAAPSPPTRPHRYQVEFFSHIHLRPTFRWPKPTGHQRHSTALFHPNRCGIRPTRLEWARCCSYATDDAGKCQAKVPSHTLPSQWGEEPYPKVRRRTPWGLRGYVGVNYDDGVG
jgi:hypothetical protein